MFDSNKKVSNQAVAPRHAHELHSLDVLTFAEVQSAVSMHKEHDQADDVFEIRARVLKHPFPYMGAS